MSCNTINHPTVLYLTYTFNSTGAFFTFFLTDCLHFVSHREEHRGRHRFRTMRLTKLLHMDSVSTNAVLVVKKI